MVVIMGGLDFPGLAQWLTALGPSGIIIGFLLYERRGQQDQIAKLQMRVDEIRLEHMADIRKYSSDTAASLAAATNVIQANTAGSDRVSSVTSRLSEAISAISVRLESVQDSVEKIDMRAR